MMSIEEIKERTAPLFRKYNVEKAYLFGSQARGDATENSDFDIYVEKGNSDKLNSLLGITSLRLELKERLNRDVDLITYLNPDKANKSFRDNLMNERVVLYGR